MILQGVFQDDRDKVIASQDEIKALQQRHEQGQGIEIEKPEAGIFEGVTEAWKGVPAGALKTMSLLEEVAANTGLTHINPDRIEQEGGYVIEDAEKHQEVLRARMESDAKKHREEANGRFGIEPDTVGMAGQILYGLAETLPKAVGYSLAGGPVGGAVAFGADYGGSEYLELRDKGVDRKTAATVGAISGIAGGVGVLLPATFGTSRLQSAVIGAVANMGLTGAELGTVGWILDRQNYDDLAMQYGLNATSVITSGVFGAAFGGAMWRPRGRAQTQAQAEPVRYFDDTQRKTVYESLRDQLKAVGGKYADDAVAQTQAEVHATYIENFTKNYGVPFNEVEAMLPNIVRDDGELDVSAFNMRSYKEKLSSEVDVWKGVIDSLESKPTQPLLMLTQTPLALKLMGAEFREIRVDPHVFDGMFPNTHRFNKKHNVHEEMTAEVIKQIPEALTDPIAVFKDDRRNDSYVFMLDIQAKGKTVITAVRFDASGLRGKLNLVKTAFGKDDPLWFDLQPNNSSVRYINEEKAKRWELASGSNSLRAPNADGSSVFTKKDLVKLREQYPGFYQKKLAFDESLMTIHNITEPGLLKAQGLGGLPAPSIAVSKASSPLQQFGEISLIGTRDLADPTKNPVFSVDAYTARFPKLDWSKSVKKSEGRELIKEVEMVQPEVGLSPGDTTVTYYLRHRPNRDEAIEKLTSSGIGMAMFLKHKGVSFKPIYKVQKRQWGVSDEMIAAYKKAVKAGNGVLNLDVGSEGREIIAKAVNDWAQSRLNAEGPISAYSKKIFKEIVEDYAKDPQMLSSKTDIVEIAHNVGRYLYETKKAKESGGEIDYYATRDALEKKVSKYQDEYKAFIANKVNNAFSAPSIVDGNKLVAFTLENVVRAMTRKPVRGAEIGDGDHSPASIRAMASKQYKSLAELQSDRARVVNRDKSYESEKKVDSVIDEFIEEVAPYYAYESKWGGFDDAANALAKAAGNPTVSNVRRSLSGFGYKSVPNEVVEKGVVALKAAKQVLTDYLEVKPQRAVAFSEFAGAVVPNTISAEARAVLEGAGLQIQTYNPKTEGARVRATQRLTKRLAKERADILYQKNQEAHALGSYNPVENTIKLTPNANLSTFSHEMGHWYLDTMFKLSGRGSADLDRDIATLLREFGVKSVEDWNALGVEGQRKYHEQFASWLEIYLSMGELPKPELRSIFERVAQWIVDVYESFGGTKKAVEGRYKSEFGIELPEMSAEVKAVMDRLFDEQKANRKMAAKKPTTEQVAAGRVVLQSSAATARIQKLLKKDRNKLTAKDARDLQDALRASDIAAQQMANGQSVDVADVVGDAEIDESMMKETRGNFAREFLMGDDDSQAVVLQNRDRDTVASVAQMNRIAAKPDYYLASTSRSLQDGAPIVSFGTMPDNAHLGDGDVVVDSSGRRIPVKYAVVEADSILTSNDYLGNANPRYGDPSQINAVAGNGRVTGIREGYNRGTAEQYKADMMADKVHGIEPEVIGAMKKPILVRFVGKNDVTSKLIDDSNKQSTLARSPVEQAVDDAKLIARNVDKYVFDDDGLPTEATVRQFVADIQDPNALGRLLTPNGSVTPEAVTRVQNAVVQASYGDMPFTELFAMETKPGAKRLMNALVAVAPRFVEIRNALGNAYDFSHQLLEGFKQVRESMLAGQDSVIQSGSIFGDDSASAFVDMLDRNRNSMAGVMRELDPIFEAIRQVQDSMGGMFGDEPMDLPEILSRVRQAQNEVRLAEGKPLLMDIDAEEMRQSMAMAQQAIDAANEVQARIDEARALEAEQMVDTEAVDPVERSRAMLTEDADAVRVAELSEEMPDMLFDVEGADGQLVKLSIADIQALNEADLARADTEAVSMGEVFACVDLNRGIE